MEKYLYKQSDNFQSEKNTSYNSKQNTISYFNFYNHYINSAEKLNYEDGKMILKNNINKLFKKDEKKYSGFLAYGEVQSGKTMNMIGSMYKAYDEGVKYIFVLTGNIKELHEQTMDRFIEERDDMIMNYIRDSKQARNIGVDIVELERREIDLDPRINFHDMLDFDEQNDRFINEVKKTLNDTEMHVYFVLKNTAHYQRLVTMFANLGFPILRNSVLIMDDEADWGFASKDESTQLYDLLVKFKEQLSNEYKLKYIGFTATPYKIFNNIRQRLITESVDEILENKTIQKITINQEYIENDPYYSGINLFHNYEFKKIMAKQSEGKLYDIFAKEYIHVIKDNWTEDNTESILKISLYIFLLNSYLYKYDTKEFESDKTINGLIFTDIKTNEHRTSKNFISDLISKAPTFRSFLEFKKYFEIDELKASEFFANLINEKDDLIAKINQEGLLDFINKWFFHNRNNNFELVIQLSGNEGNDYQILKEKKSKGLLNNYLIIGGYKISRGVTFDNLVLETITYKSDKDDSTLQRARWFGYRKYANLMNLDILMSESVKESFQRATEEDTKLRKIITKKYE